MKKRILYTIYIICIIAGGFVGFFIIDLPPTNTERPVVDVKVEAAEPVLIRDTITKIDVKYRYLYRNRCCCETCP